MENEIIFVQGCLDCPFYAISIKHNAMGYTEDGFTAWCNNLDKQIKYYKINKMPKNCPLRTKNITIAADIK